jgi:tripartite-type tricarboxylate transporter receptor subunit TctC
MTAWNGYFAPAGTPRPIVDELANAIATLCHDPKVIKLMSDLGVDAVGGTPEELAAVIRADLPVYRAAVEAAGLLRQ